MSIKKKNNGKYTVDIINEFGKRIQRTFTKKNQAEAFESSIIRKKYEIKLVSNNLINARHPLSISIEDYIRTKQHLRPKSIQKYKAVMEFFQDFTIVNNIKYLDEFGVAEAEFFYNILIAERVVDKGNHKVTIKAKPKTINFYLTSVKEFFKRELLKDRIPKSPFAHIKNLKIDRPKPEYFSKEELLAFFRQTMKKEYLNAFKGLLLTGMRFAEFVNIQVKDINIQERTISVNNKIDFMTKTLNGVRIIPMSDELFGIVTELILNKKQDDYIFTSPKGSKLSERSLLEVCKRVAKSAKITSRAFLHKFRHTFATHLVQNDVPLETIKELLGHSSVVETEIYAHNKTNHRHHQVNILDNLLNS